jgi:hypothetical protein
MFTTVTLAVCQATETKRSRLLPTPVCQSSALTRAWLTDSTHLSEATHLPETTLLALLTLLRTLCKAGSIGPGLDLGADFCF